METIFVACGSSRLDQRATRDLIAQVALRTTEEPGLVVLSLARVREMRWAALRRLAAAIGDWRTRHHGVVVQTPSRPSQRSLLAAAGVLSAATAVGIPG